MSGAESGKTAGTPPGETPGYLSTDAFSEYLSRQGLRPRTEAEYVACVRRYLAASGGVGYDRETAERWLMTLGSGSRVTAIAALRRYIRAMRAKGVIAEPPDVHVNKATRTQLPGPLSAGQLAALKAAIETMPEALGLPLVLMLNTGFRVGRDGETGLLRLRVGDIVDDGAGKPVALRTTNKGGKDRMVALNEAASKAVASLREMQTTRGKGATLVRATYPQLSAALKRAVPGTSLHKLRHTYATALLSAGVPLESVQEALGHADISTTRIYAHVDLQRLQAICRRVEI